MKIFRLFSRFDGFLTMFFCFFDTTVHLFIEYIMYIVIFSDKMDKYTLLDLNGGL
jgi:hypothetical protein